MDPFTPKPRRSVRKNKLTLSSKQYSKITGTIASLRRSRQPNGDIGEDGELILEEEPSFIEEKSFIDAPLNSRVPAGSSAYKGKEKAESLDRLPIEIQEALILEDLLFVLMGVEGTYITYPTDHSVEDVNPLQGVHFVVSPNLDASLRDLVERVLPLATYYTAIASFIEFRSHRDYGLVNHALCAAIRDMLKDYQTLLSQLEHAFSTSPTFSLQKLWFYVHPTLHTLSLIHGLTTQLVQAEEPPDSDSSDESEIDPEEEARNEALGLGGAKLKAVLSNITKGVDGTTFPVPAKGGEVLAILTERMQLMSGDPSALSLHKALMRAAGKPYADMLVTWMRYGKLKDPYDEFCVKENTHLNQKVLEGDYIDEYWEKRFALRDGSTAGNSAKRPSAGVPMPRTPGGRLPGGACIPTFLEPWKHKILLAGKYVNVIQEFGLDIRRDEIQEKDVALDDEEFYKSIEAAYQYANDTLVKLLLHDQQLIPRLRSLRYYFFLSQSSYLTLFLDLAHSELRKSSRSASLSKLQSLLDVALNADGSRFTPEGEPTYKEDVKVHMAKQGVYEWLIVVLSVNGEIADDHEAVMDERKDKDDKEKKAQLFAIDALELDYNVKFPLSLVISRRSILKYQVLFRFLLHLRHVEQSLSSMWIEQKTQIWRTPVPGHPDFELWRRRICNLRAKMLAWIQQIYAFATYEVLEPNWLKLEAAMAKVTTVDQLLRDHDDFLNSCMKECMLTNSRMMKAYSKLIVTCSTFALYAAQFTKQLQHSLAAFEEAGDASAAPVDKRLEFLSKFEANFNHWNKTFLDYVQYFGSSENGALLPLGLRLNSIKCT